MAVRGSAAIGFSGMGGSVPAGMRDMGCAYIATPSAAKIATPSAIEIIVLVDIFDEGALRTLCRRAFFLDHGLAFFLMPARGANCTTLPGRRAYASNTDLHLGLRRFIALGRIASFREGPNVRSPSSNRRSSSDSKAKQDSVRSIALGRIGALGILLISLLLL